MNQPAIKRLIAQKNGAEARSTALAVVDMAARSRRPIIFLFDVDGTLVPYSNTGNPLRPMSTEVERGITSLQGFGKRVQVVAATKRMPHIFDRFLRASEVRFSGLCSMGLLRVDYDSRGRPAVNANQKAVEIDALVTPFDSRIARTASEVMGEPYEVVTLSEKQMFEQTTVDYSGNKVIVSSWPGVRVYDVYTNGVKNTSRDAEFAVALGNAPGTKVVVNSWLGGGVKIDAYGETDKRLSYDEIRRDNPNALIVVAGDDSKDVPLAEAVARDRAVGNEALFINVINPLKFNETLVHAADYVVTSPAKLGNFIGDDIVPTLSNAGWPFRTRSTFMLGN